MDLDFGYASIRIAFESQFHLRGEVSESGLGLIVKGLLGEPFGEKQPVQAWTRE